MKIYAYSAPQGRCAALAADDTSLLPDEFGPWERLGEMEINPGDPDRLGMPTDVTLDNLQTHGTHFFKLEMTFE